MDHLYDQIEQVDSSLLPYVDPAGTRLRLEFPPDNASVQPDQSGSFPFTTVGPDQPLFKSVKARIITDGDSVVRPVHAILQHDGVSIESGTANLAHNGDIDRCWQTTHRHYARESGFSTNLIHFAEQLGPQDTPLPFQPLFYCTFTQCYFQPPCPYCGDPVVLCRNEDILIRAGLKSYSESLSRYLHCPSCCLSFDKPVFYAPEKNDSDPPSLRIDGTSSAISAGS